MAQNNNPFFVAPGNDYSSGLSGLSNTLLNVRQQQMQNAELQRRQEKEDRANQRFQDVQTAAMKAFESQDPDFIAKTAVQYPEITPMLKEATGLKDEVQNRDALEFTRQFAQASDEQRPALYQRRIEAIQKRGGDPSHTIQSYQDYLQDPQAETRDLISYWAGIDPKGYSAYSDEQKAAKKAQSEDRRFGLEQQKMDQQQSLFNQAESGRNQRAYARSAQLAGATAADKRTAHQKDFEQYQALAKEDPDAAKAFGQAAGFVSKEGRELAPGVQTRLAKTIDSAVSSENNISRFNSLADDFERSNLKGGYLGGSWAEKAKEITGDQDAATNLRKEFAQVRASQASANLPPGSASDADVALALGPIPSDNANKQQIVSYLRGQAKIAKLASDFHNFKADYISDTGSERGMLQAWKQQGKGQSQQARPTAAPTPSSNDGWEIVQ